MADNRIYNFSAGPSMLPVPVLERCASEMLNYKGCLLYTSLRQAVNGICDEASRLEARVEGIVVDTFGDTITEEMLSDELDANLMRRSDLYFGTYTGDGVYPREITLGFAPKMVFIMRADGMTGSTGYTRCV